MTVWASPRAMPAATPGWGESRRMVRVGDIADEELAVTGGEDLQGRAADPLACLPVDLLGPHVEQLGVALCVRQHRLEYRSVCSAWQRSFVMRGGAHCSGHVRGRERQPPRGGPAAPGCRRSPGRRPLHHPGSRHRQAAGTGDLMDAVVMAGAAGVMRSGRVASAGWRTSTRLLSCTAGRRPACWAGRRSSVSGCGGREPACASSRRRRCGVSSRGGRDGLAMACATPGGHRSWRVRGAGPGRPAGDDQDGADGRLR